ncbi:hypothetical protein OPT61_g1902 [Boeremia exigua]|uniref:Uncharacterized protein n=1 Tax=Boeremia exigua TaxID=749465 RepID=A0ACC2INN3_9PLEO|nr:hypothetical protein OPT61_g1902 [Boeremia exigua]
MVTEREGEEQQKRGRSARSCAWAPGAYQGSALKSAGRITLAQNRTKSTVRIVEPAMLNKSRTGELEASNGCRPACSFAGTVKARNRAGTRQSKKSHAAWRAMLVAKLAFRSDTARQWSSFAPQKQRCLHGRGRQPLKTLLDAGKRSRKTQPNHTLDARSDPITARSAFAATARW